MKQKQNKQETKVTTLARLVAVYNNMVRTPGGPAVRMDIIVKHGISVFLVLSIDDNENTVYNGNIDGGIAFMAHSLCGCCFNANVSVKVSF